MARNKLKVVVTGGSAGVGRAAAEAFAQHGHDVALIARDPARLERAANELTGRYGVKALALPADVANAEAVDGAAEEALQAFGRLDVWVNVAMATAFAPVAALNARDIERGTQVTYLGQVNGMLAALRCMRAAGHSGRGTIVNVGSALSYRAVPLQSVYCGAKFAIRSFTDALRSELLHDGVDIHLTMVDLPAINTPQFDWAMNLTGRRARPVPPVFQPEVAARAIYFAATHRRRQVWVGWSTAKAILANRFAPGLFDRYLARRVSRTGHWRATAARCAVESLHASAGRLRRARPLRRRSPRAQPGNVHGSPPLGGHRGDDLRVRVRRVMGMAQKPAMNDPPQASSASAAPGTSRYRPLEDYALLGDGQSAALADRDGAIDWLCWPRFDSPAVFAPLLGGTEESGHWTVHPAQGTHWTVSRGYLADTLVLVTTFETVTGRATLTDFLHTDGSRSPRAMYRIIECTSGEVTMHSDLQLRFDFGQLRPWIEAQGEAFSVRCGAHRVRLSCEGQIAHDIGDACVRSHFVLRQGERNALRLTHALEAEVSSGAPLPAWPDADVALDQTVAYWRGWLSGVDMRSCPWAQSVTRSLLTLKALIYRPSGAMVAACTSSLPEVPGGSANWDYRYSWLRDGCFAMGAFLNAGLRDEAQRWLHWMFDAVGTSPGGVQTLYRVDGERQIPEWELGALEGYRYSQCAWATRLPPNVRSM